jgi:hypothetical protein
VRREARFCASLAEKRNLSAVPTSRITPPQSDQT